MIYLPTSAVKFGPNTEIGRLFNQYREGLDSPVDSDYLHMTMSFAPSKKLLNQKQKAACKEIIKIASEKMKNETSFKTGKIIVKDNGYVLLEVESKNIQDIAEFMYLELKKLGLDCNPQHNFLHITLRKGVFVEKLPQNELNELRLAYSKLNQLENASFSLNNAPFGVAEYEPKKCVITQNDVLGFMMRNSVNIALLTGLIAIVILAIIAPHLFFGIKFVTGVAVTSSTYAGINFFCPSMNIGEHEMAQTIHTPN
ncbi:MAG: hypothetical protein NXI01_08760 [Gammaproteobacteria bacterium]|nr:hypothetical protein [Gammaproteobacteria bacterium]